MARLQSTPEDPAVFNAVDEHGTVLATGVLEVDLIPEATRHGSIRFVTGDGDSRPLAAGRMGLDEFVKRSGG